MLEDFQHVLTTLGLIALVVIVIYFLEQRRLRKVQSDRDYAIFMQKFAHEKALQDEKTKEDTSD